MILNIFIIINVLIVWDMLLFSDFSIMHFNYWMFSLFRIVICFRPSWLQLENLALKVWLIFFKKLKLNPRRRMVQYSKPLFLNLSNFRMFELQLSEFSSQNVGWGILGSEVYTLKLLRLWNIVLKVWNKISSSVFKLEILIIMKLRSESFKLGMFCAPLFTTIW